MAFRKKTTSKSYRNNYDQQKLTKLITQNNYSNESISKQHYSMASQSSVNFTSYRVISEVTDGSYFGEISLVGNLPVTATAHAISNSI